MEEKSCFESIKSHLEKNELKEAFSKLDNYLSKIGISTDLTPFFISTSSQLFRTEKAFKLGTISWEQYNISSSQIIIKAIELANEICNYLEQRKKYPFDLVDNRSVMVNMFHNLANEIAISVYDELGGKT